MKVLLNYLLDHRHSLPILIGFVVTKVDIYHTWIVFLAFSIYAVLKHFTERESHKEYLDFILGYLTGLGAEIFI